VIILQRDVLLSELSCVRVDRLLEAKKFHRGVGNIQFRELASWSFPFGLSYRRQVPGG
jgi:hypothetical protein